MAKNTDILKMKTATIDQIKDKIVELKKHLMNLRFSLASGKISNLSEIRKTRRDVARLKTFLNEKKKEVIKK